MGFGKRGSSHQINYRCEESELSGLPLCVLCFSSSSLSYRFSIFSLLPFIFLTGHYHLVFNSLISVCERENKMAIEPVRKSNGSKLKMLNRQDNERMEKERTYKGRPDSSHPLQQ